MKLNKKQRYAIAIIFIIVYSFIMIYYSPLQPIMETYGKIDPDTKHIITTIVVAGIGFVIFVTRQLKIKDEQKEQLEAWELAVLIIFPSTELFTYVVKEISNWPWAILAYIAGVMVWFVFVVCRHKVFKDPKEEKKFNFTISYALFVFVIYGTFAFWMLNSITSSVK